MSPAQREYSSKYLQLAIKCYSKSDSEHEITNKMFRSKSSIRSMITKYRKIKSIANLADKDRKRKTTIRVNRIIQWKIRANRWKSACSVKRNIMQETGIAIPSKTDRCYAHQLGLYEFFTWRRSHVNKANWLKRLNYIKMHHEKPRAVLFEVM